MFTVSVGILSGISDIISSRKCLMFVNWSFLHNFAELDSTNFAEFVELESAYLDDFEGLKNESND